MNINIIKKRLLDLYSFSPPIKFYTYLKMFILPFKEFSADLPRDGFILDVGTGYGYMANFTALESPQRRVLGIDIDEKRISIAKRTIDGRKNIGFTNSDIRQCNEINDIDVAIMADVLHHIPVKDHKEFLQCLYNKLKIGGTFIIRDTNKKMSIKYCLMNYLLEVILYPCSERCRFYSSEQLKDLLEQAGFKIIKRILSNSWFVYETVVYVCKK